MQQFLRWQTEEGPVVVEIDDEDGGYQPVKRNTPKITDVPGRFEEALAHARSAALSALRTFRDGALSADELSLEFGVKLTAEAGAVLAKTGADAHLTVRVNWKRQPASGADVVP